jgi:hypothetical protein
MRELRQRIGREQHGLADFAVEEVPLFSVMG